MRVLVVGASGYIAGRAIEILGQAKHEIYAATRDVDFLKSNSALNVENIFDSRDADALRLSLKSVDAVLYAAGLSASHCIRNPELAFEVHQKLPTELAHLAREADVERFIYLSTVHVYADPLDGIFSESSATTNLHPYATSHIAGEKSIINSLSGTNTKAIILRLANVFGRPMLPTTSAWELVVNNMCNQAAKRGAIHLSSNGLHKRDFIPMQEVCNSILKVLDTGFQDQNQQIFNVSTGFSKSVIAVAKEIKLVFHSEFNLNIDIKENLLDDSPPQEELTIESHLTSSLLQSKEECFKNELRDLINYCIKFK